jgi:hypothetical protein
MRLVLAVAGGSGLGDWLGATVAKTEGEHTHQVRPDTDHVVVARPHDQIDQAAAEDLVLPVPLGWWGLVGVVCSPPRKMPTWRHRG